MLPGKCGNDMIERKFWNKKRVFLTGHTGFKGAWLGMCLHQLGADVTGFALNPPTDPNLFELCKIGENIKSVIADIRDKNALKQSISESRPEIIIHMAAQALVIDSYRDPGYTFEVNAMGVSNLFEAVRKIDGIKSIVNVTTDKCYENKEWCWGYRENETLGGYDPYSASKACSEIITAAYRQSFFNPDEYRIHGIAIATARAGNVIGGGDWAPNRLLADCAKALLNGEKIIVRNPLSIRPWQYVLEPLKGYLMVAERLYKEGIKYAGAWNFGPSDEDAKPVEWIVKKICEKWGDGASYEVIGKDYPHEAGYLKLDCSKARALLSWKPVWELERALEKIIEWLKVYKSGGDLRSICNKQIEEYISDSSLVR